MWHVDNDYVFHLAIEVADKDIIIRGGEDGIIIMHLWPGGDPAIEIDLDQDFEDMRVENLTFRALDNTTQRALHINGAPTIEDCIFITPEEVSANGGAICAQGVDAAHRARITNCEFNGYSTYLDGVAIWGNYVDIDYCCFSDNQDSYSNGSIVYLQNGLVDDCTFEENTILDGAVIWGNNVSIANCWFSDNEDTGNNGSIVHLQDGLMGHCVFEGNTLAEPVGTDAGIVCVDSDSEVRYSTFVDNTCPALHSLSPSAWPYILGTIVKSDCDFNLIPTDMSYNVWYSCMDDPNLGLPFNRPAFEDPRFVNEATGDYRLLPDSDCIDFVDGDEPDDPDGSRPEIGYCYYPQIRFVPVEYSTIQAAMVDNYNGAEVAVSQDPGTYSEYLVIDGSYIIEGDPDLDFGIRKDGTEEWSYTPINGQSFVFYINDLEIPITFRDLDFTGCSGCTPTPKAIHGYWPTETCELTLDNCTFDDFGDLTNPVNGGAVFANATTASPVVEIVNCVFDDCKGDNGGAVYVNSVDGTGVVEIKGDTEFLNNDAALTGGAVLTHGCHLWIGELETHHRVRFHNNYAAERAGAIFAYFSGDLPGSGNSHFYNTDFISNSCGWTGYACADVLHFTLNTTSGTTGCTFENCLIEHESQTAFYNYRFDNITVTRSTVFSLVDPPPVSIQCDESNETMLTVNSSILSSPPSNFGADFYDIDYTNIVNGTIPGPSSPYNIQADPKFVNPANDNYCLRWDSPCLDTGNPDPLLRDQDHTQCDMGYRQTYKPIPCDAGTDFTSLTKGVYFATDDLNVASGFSLPSGSFLLLGSLVDVTIIAGTADVFLGREEDAERTVITYYSPNPEIDFHEEPDPPRGAFSISGSPAVPPAADLHMNHLGYVETESEFAVTWVDLSVNDLRFCTDDCDEPESTVHGRFYVGSGCVGTISNCLLRGSWMNEQMVIFDSNVMLSDCDFLDYEDTGLLLVDFGHNADYELQSLDFEGYGTPERARIGVSALNSSFRLTDSRVENHDSYGMKGSYAWFDMHRVAHNRIVANSFPNPNHGQISLNESNCQLDCGANKIAYNDDDNDNILIRDQGGLQQQSTDVHYNDWGDAVVDPSSPRLLPECWGILVWDPLYVWNELPPMNDCNEQNIPAEMFALGNWQEINGQIPEAIFTYNQLIILFPSDPYATRAVFRLKKISGMGRDEGLAVKAGFEEDLEAIGDQNPDLTYFLEGNFWILEGKLIDKDVALTELEGLRDQAGAEDASTYYELSHAYLEAWDDAGSPYAERDPDTACQQVRTELARQQAYINQALEICGMSTNTSADPEVLPADFNLTQNYPNPFNPVTTIAYSVPTHCELTLAVYNVLGQRVAVLAEGSHLPGDYALQFDGSEFSSGLYLYRLDSGTHSVVRKMMLIK